MFYSDVPVHHRITPASISTYHASTYFLVFMFYSDVPIHCRITPTSISTYHAIKIFSCFHVLFRCASSSPNYSCQHFHISCIQIFSCSHVLFRCANSSPNYSCQHFHISCIKIFSCFMFYSDVLIHCRITPSSISTYHALKIFSCSHVFF